MKHEPWLLSVLCDQAVTFPERQNGIELQRGECLLSVRQFSILINQPKSSTHRIINRWKQAGIIRVEHLKRSGSKISISPKIFGHFNPSKPDEYEQFVYRLKSSIGLPTSPITIIEKSEVRKWIVSLKISPAEIVEIAKRSAPDIVLHHGRIRSITDFSQHMDAHHATV